MSFLLLGLALGCGTLRGDERSTGYPATFPIVAASNFLHPPFSSQDEDGVAVGMEIDLLAEAASRLEITSEWIELPFRDLINAVAERQVRVAASTIGITAERSQIVQFTSPYFTTRIVALARMGADEPKQLSDLSKRSIGTETATTAVSAAKKHLPEAKRVTERLPDMSWAQMLEAGDIDAVVLDESHAQKFMADAGVQFHIIEEALAEEHFAFALHTADDELLQALNSVIARKR